MITTAPQQSTVLVCKVHLPTILHPNHPPNQLSAIRQQTRVQQEWHNHQGQPQAPSDTFVMCNHSLFCLTTSKLFNDHLVNHLPKQHYVSLLAFWASKHVSDQSTSWYASKRCFKSILEYYDIWFKSTANWIFRRRKRFGGAKSASVCWVTRVARRLMLQFIDSPVILDIASVPQMLDCH